MTILEGLKRMIDRQLEDGKKEENIRRREVQKLFTERARVHATIKGKVHGVFFRDFAKKKADALGLSGWVRNTSLGVEVVAEGEKNQLRKFIVALKKGNPLSTVEEVDYEYSTYTGAFDEFYINY